MSGLCSVGLRVPRCGHDYPAVHSMSEPTMTDSTYGMQEPFRMQACICPPTLSLLSVFLSSLKFSLEYTRFSKVEQESSSKLHHC